MGEIINVRCKSCKREWQCFTGSGLLYGKKEHILAAFSEGERRHVESLFAASAIPAYDFQYRLAVCGHCHNVVAVPTLGMMDSEETYVGLCPLCGKKTKNFCPAEMEIELWCEDMACPVCKSQGLYTEEGGYWD